ADRRRMLEALTDECLAANAGEAHRDSPGPTPGPPPAGETTTPDWGRTSEALYGAVPPIPPSAPRARFRVLRPHAKGGLGEVSVAEDTELGRQVALKEIRPDRADDPVSRLRFVREAELTG